MAGPTRTRKPGADDGPAQVESLPPFDESDTHVDVPSLRTARRTGPPSTFGPSIARSSPSEERPNAIPPRSDPTMPRIAVPASPPQSARRPWITAALAVVAGALVGLAVVAMFARREPTAVASSGGPPIEAAVAGGVIEVAPPGPDRGALVLHLTPAGAATVRISSSTWDTSWTGTERMLELRGLPAGRYSTSITPAGGATIRDTVDVLDQRSCRYTFDVPSGALKWTREDCP